LSDLPTLVTLLAIGTEQARPDIAPTVASAARAAVAEVSHAEMGSAAAALYRRRSHRSPPGGSPCQHRLRHRTNRVAAACAKDRSAERQDRATGPDPKDESLTAKPTRSQHQPQNNRPNNPNHPQHKPVGDLSSGGHADTCSRFATRSCLASDLPIASSIASVSVAMEKRALVSSASG
jgi:hypothetical protein